jgi:hypothetical protein
MHILPAIPVSSIISAVWARHADRGCSSVSAGWCTALDPPAIFAARLMPPPQRDCVCAPGWRSLPQRRRASRPWLWLCRGGGPCRAAPPSSASRRSLSPGAGARPATLLGWYRKSSGPGIELVKRRRQRCQDAIHQLADGAQEMILGYPSLGREVAEKGVLRRSSPRIVRLSMEKVRSMPEPDETIRSRGHLVKPQDMEHFQHPARPEPPNVRQFWEP